MNTLLAPIADAGLGQSTLPKIATIDGGASLVSGATASLQSGTKFALSGLTQSLVRQYQCQDVDVFYAPKGF